MSDLQNLRDLWNNAQLKLGYFPLDSYNENIKIGQFTELTYNNKPLLQNIPTINKSVYSLLFENKDFSNFVSVKLLNETLLEAISATSSREIAYTTATEFDFKNYMWGLWFSSGVENFQLYTGKVESVKINSDVVTLNLNSRVHFLNKESGEKVKNNFAGWLTNTRFNTSLNAILNGSDVVVNGDITGIDYEQTINEGDIDLKTFLNSSHVSFYDNDIIYIAYEDKKYNFQTNSISLGIGKKTHFHFLKGSDHYYVFEKDNANRMGNYVDLYLYNETTQDETYIGMGRTADSFDNSFSIDFNTTIKANEQHYMYKTNKTNTYISRGHVYYEPTVDAIPNENVLMTEIFKIGDYYCPVLFEKKNFEYYEVFSLQGENEPKDFQVTYDARGYIEGKSKLFSGGVAQARQFSTYRAGGCVHNVSYSYITETSNTNIIVDKQKSYKNRSYFYYDTTQDRLFFQRASEYLPTGNSEIIDTDYTKTWDNFGLNPIGFYSFATNSLGYSNLKKQFIL